MKIYTKTGDDGTTGLLGGTRCPKDSLVIQAVGDIDELNGGIGVAIAITPDGELSQVLRRIQHWLFDLGGQLAAPNDGRWELFSHATRAVSELELDIDRQTATLAPLKNFILPGGTHLAAELHRARAVCRRAERSLVAMSRNLPLDSEILVFVNRLSDWLFVAARTANALQGVQDVPWAKTEES